MPQSVSQSIKRRIDRFRRKQRRHPKAKRLLAEGDSWFSFGHLMWFRKSLIGKLNDYKSVNIVSVANPGAELESIVKRENRDWALANNPDWLKNQTYDALLFSGGGNDIVGTELKNYLYKKSATRTGVQLIKKSVFEDALHHMKEQYRELRRTVDADIRSPNGGTVPIITHGYDYAHPSGEGFELLGGLVTLGPWILPNFMEKEIDNLDEQVEIINFLVDQFNELQNTLQTSARSGIEAFYHIDLRGCLKREDWADELHPTAAGRDKLAAKLRGEIVSIV
jgi:hypothetical protein